MTRRLLAGAVAVAGSAAAACRTAAAPATTAGQGPVTVELLAGLTAEQRAAIQSVVIDPFEQAHPGLRLSIVEAPPAQVDQKLLALTAAGTPPDVAFNAPPYLYLGKLTQDLTPRVRRDRYDTAAFAKDGFESAATWKGRMVGLPYYVGGHSSVLPYNADLFRAAGVPEPPARWGAPEWNAESWLRVLQRTTQRDPAGAMRSYGSNVTLYTFYTFYLSTLWRGAWLSSDMHTITCDSPQMIGAFEYFAALSTQQHVVATTAELQEAFGDASAEQAFLNGRLAMYATPGAQNIAPIPPAVRTRGLPLAYAPLPTFETFGAAHYYLTNGLVVGAKHPDEGWTYAKWAADTPNWCISRGQPPAKAELFEAWAKTVYGGIERRVRLEVYRDSLRHPVKLDPLFHVPAQQRVQMIDVIQAGLDRMWAGAPAAATLRDFKTQLQPLVPSIPDG
jgi:ABC-type glycerol-3-phosphate transport system substrate-binding protein